MPDLLHTLEGRDLGFLKMVASGWGIELNAPDALSGRTLLIKAMPDSGLVHETIETLSAEAQTALQTLLGSGGLMPWALFTRRFGEVRPMGAARRDRERPDLSPISAAEVLWYHALVGKAFLNLGVEPQEYAYIPDDLLALMQPVRQQFQAPLGRPASPAECAHCQPATDQVLDEACTLLAGLRLGLPLSAIPHGENHLSPGERHLLSPGEGRLSPKALVALLDAAHLLDANQVPLPEPTRAFLEPGRARALAYLCQEWMESDRFNELRLLPGLVCEGEWSNDPRLARKTLLEWISQVPEAQWWSLTSFINSIRELNPDYLRPAGDYDSWFIRAEGSETYLRGFSCWDEVDGALIRYLITGPMAALGLVDLACAAPGQAPAAFRLSGWAAALWQGSPPPGLPEEDGAIHVQSDGLIAIEPHAPRAARYQISRFCHWEPARAGFFRYRITPAALERAQKQGLRPGQLITLLRKYASPLPPLLLQALERWEQSGSQVKIESGVWVRASSPKIIDLLRRSRAARYLGEELNPTTLLVRPGGEETVLSVLLEAGYLAEARLLQTKEG